MQYFTLREANALLPVVRAIIGKMLESRQRILDLQPELWPAIQAAATNGGSKAASKAANEIAILQGLIGDLNRLGVLLKDLNTGLIDFPALYRGREVFLCWQYGEEQVSFWHEVDAGFAGRQPVIAGEWE